jgi:hypothetical protein
VIRGWKSDLTTSEWPMLKKPARKLPTHVVDMTFNAWWQVYGNKPSMIDQALKKTRKQIGGPMPANYVPPPRRRKAVKKQPKPSTRAPQSKEKAAKQTYKHYINNAPRGLNRLRMDLRAAHRWPRFPKPLRDRLMRLPCYADPNKQWAAEMKLINEYYEQIGDGKYHGPIMAGNGKMYASEEAYRRERWLNDLKFMAESTVGAGVYGLERAAGVDHETAMSRARVAQVAFDMLAAGKADPASKRQEIRDYARPPASPRRTNNQGVPHSVRK